MAATPMNPILKWSLIAGGAIIAIILIVVLIKKLSPAATQPPIILQPGQPPASQPWYASLISTLGPGLSNWIFGSGSGTSNSNCQLGVVTGSNPCIDDCGFPVSSDVNPVCL